MVLTEDQFTQLLAAVGPKKGSIASCQAKYNGEKSSEAVESFLTAINIFKQLENISEKTQSQAYLCYSTGRLANGGRAAREKEDVASAKILATQLKYAVCRKRQRMENSREDPQDTASRPNLLALPITQPKVSCYGCGAPGVVRTKCPNCSQKTQIAPIKPEDISFCSLNATDARARPVVFITINGFNGVAYIDTGAKMSVASYELYRHLCNQGCGFKQKVLNVTLADGITKRQTVLLAKVRVTLSDKEITTEFMVMPESRDNRTLLGIGFLTDAAMVLNLGQASWHFAENPNEEFELYNEDFATFKEPTDNPVVAAVSNTGNDPSLRAEKSRRGPIYGATASTNLDSTVPWNYNLIRIADLPPTLNVAKYSMVTHPKWTT
ncbi:unnamed protein product [Plutella xylostella]|uniref:(diamondback moth) hypothetical protein n=1 Tax=Plutella xylostella TaxID=51655 RepID=A0A8S4FS35_PLUXY|nr:unnamed protein product [Plutella xylostella]